MSDARGLRNSHLAALAGAVLALCSLWAPWYRVHLPAALRDALAHGAGTVPAPIGGFVQSLAALLPESVSGDAWQVLHRIDVAVAFLAAAALAALLAAGGSLGAGVRVDRDAAARIAAGAGLVAGLLVAGRIADPPGPHAYVDVRWGAWACLLGCALMLAGGLLSLRPREQAAPLMPAPVAPPPPAVTGSVAPPA
jgi:hypothetical protein